MTLALVLALAFGAGWAAVVVGRRLRGRRAAAQRWTADARVRRALSVRGPP